MNLNAKRWKKLFLFCLGLSIGTAFCMKWMEPDFEVNGQPFTIMGLELFYSKEKVISILEGLDFRVRTILSYHLYFDFVFMAGIFPGIASLCMLAREKVNALFLRKILFMLAFFQLLGWIGDICENLYLLRWLDKPEIGTEFGLYHFIVAGKWIIALTGVLISVIVLLCKRKKF